MGNSEEAKSAKPEKFSSPASDHTNVHVYPDWAAMQAYYGPRVGMPPYFNSPVASGHPPHPYMWGPGLPQHMMPPYGTPYATIYAHGGVYAHPGVPLGSPANCHHGIALSNPASEPLTAVPFSMDKPAKSSASNDRGFMSKLKSFDGLAMSLGNGNTDSGEGGADSRSEETEGSSDGSNGNTTGVAQKNKKRSREGTPSNDEEEKVPRSPISAGERNVSSDKVMALAVAPNTADKVMGAVVSPNTPTNLELRNSSGANMKSNPSTAPQSNAIIQNEAWLQNERELRRERRKQSNRESARRSRLRKQAETEELAKKVQSLIAENMTLKSEISKITENSEQLRHENTSLMEKLKNARGQKDEMNFNNFDEMRLRPVGTADLLGRVNNSAVVAAAADRASVEAEAFENKSSGTKLHQLLDASPRTDAVAAG